MKKSRFKTEQIIGIVKEADSGLKASDLARKHGVSEHTIYRWRSKRQGTPRQTCREGSWKT